VHYSALSWSCWFEASVSDVRTVLIFLLLLESYRYIMRKLKSLKILWVALGGGSYDLLSTHAPGPSLGGDEPVTANFRKQGQR
jgi:hypothetical protein